MIFFLILKTKSDHNTPQNTPNCAIKKISRGACPRTPLTKRMASPCAACRLATCKFPYLKKYFLAPPPKSWLCPWGAITNLIANE